VAEGRAPHRPDELPACFLHVAMVQGKPGCPGESREAEEEVVQPLRVDRSQPELQVVGCLRPLAAVHGEPRELGLADGDRVPVARPGYGA
jgi:hypothetical protein